MISSIALLVTMALNPATPAPIEAWSGTMSRSGDRLNVRFDLPAGAPQRATFSAPDLGAIDIPLQHVELGSKMHWELVGDTTTTIFNGELRGRAIAGTFSENGRSGAFFLTPVTGASARPYVKRDVTFRDGAVQLSGTLFLPRASGLHPAIIFVHGSGDEGRWASAFLADYAARHRIVALVYDKRGVGASRGNWRTATVTDLARDARAGIKLLSRTPGVNPHRIGVYGHSQGGEIAPAIAEGNSLVSFVIDADGPIGPQYLQDIYRVNTYLAQHYSGTQLADAEKVYREFVDVARSGAPHDRLRADIRGAGSAPWLAALAIPDDSSWIWTWYAHYGDYDDRSAWANVRVPVLLLFGAKDALVPVQSSISQVVAILKQSGNANVTVRIFDDADHTLHVPPQSPDGWPHLPDGFPDVIANFIFGNATYKASRANRSSSGSRPNASASASASPSGSSSAATATTR